MTAELFSHTAKTEAAISEVNAMSHREIEFFLIQLTGQFAKRAQNTEDPEEDRAYRHAGLLLNHAWALIRKP